MSKTIIQLVFSPGMFAVAGLFIAGAGIALALSQERTDVVKAQWCFAAVLILGLGTSARLIIESGWTDVARYISLFIAFGTIGTIWFGTYDWVDTKLVKFTTQQSAADVKPPPPTLPSATTDFDYEAKRKIIFDIVENYKRNHGGKEPSIAQINSELTRQHRPFSVEGKKEGKSPSSLIAVEDSSRVGNVSLHGVTVEGFDQLIHTSGTGQVDSLKIVDSEIRKDQKSKTRKK